MVGVKYYLDLRVIPCKNHPESRDLCLNGKQIIVIFFFFLREMTITKKEIQNIIAMGPFDGEGLGRKTVPARKK